MAIIGKDIGMQIINALRLDGQRIQSIDLHIATDEVVTATIKWHYRGDEAAKLVEVLERYELVNKVTLDA